MATFGRESEEHLAQTHPILRLTLMEAIHYVNFKVVCAFRDQEEQNEAFKKGLTKLQWPDGKHNLFPSLAVDIAPYPIDWSNEPKAKARFYYVAGFIHGIFQGRKAQSIIPPNVDMRWGGDWDGDLDFKDQTFDDLGHIELVFR